MKCEIDQAEKLKPAVAEFITSEKVNRLGDMMAIFIKVLATFTTRATKVKVIKSMSNEILIGASWFRAQRMWTANFWTTVLFRYRNADANLWEFLHRLPPQKLGKFFKFLLSSRNWNKGSSWMPSPWCFREDSTSLPNPWASIGRAEGTGLSFPWGISYAEGTGLSFAWGIGLAEGTGNVQGNVQDDCLGVESWDQQDATWRFFEGTGNVQCDA